MTTPKLIDLHEDLLLHVNRRDLFSDHWQTNFEMLHASETKVVIAIAFPYPENKNFSDSVTNKMIEQDFLEYAQRCDNTNFHLLRNSNDLRASMNQVGTGIILHVEGLNAFSNNNWDMLEHWYDMGWRSLGLVWNITNNLGGGTKDTAAGLSPLGSDVIEWCEQRGVIIDFAHMNYQTFMDASEIVTRPILVSHGNAHALCPNPRNYTNEQLDLITQSNGVVGVFFAKAFVADKPVATVVDVADHIDYLVERMGIDHVGIGTDLGGVISGLVEDLDCITGMSRLWDELFSRGYKQEDVEMIAWKNALRVLEQHFDAR